MGVEIVKAAVVYGKNLSGNAYKVLVAMSLSALDKPSNGRPASLYWGGWDALAVVLGHEHAARDSSGHVLVKRAIKELREGRHITPMNDARRGVAQTYMVHPGGLPKGEQKVPAKGEQSVPAGGEQKVPTSGNESFPPRKDSGSTGLNEDIDLIRRPEPQEAALAAAEDEMGRPHKFQGRPGDDCTSCGKGYANRAAHPFRLIDPETA